MNRVYRVAILSDVHYAGAAEQARGNDYELEGIANPAVRLLVKVYRRFFWLRNPLNQGYLLDRFLDQANTWDFVVANGDYSCNTNSVGLSDDATYASVRECLSKLRRAFGDKLRVNYGDHELGKVSFFGGRGGMRLASLRRAQSDLGLEPFWDLRVGEYVLMGVASSLVALPVFERDALREELREWERLRAAHLQNIREAFQRLQPSQRILLFCHDPTALPFLAELGEVRDRLPQLEQTIIGHLHSNLILWKSRRLAGMPRIHFLGHSARRFSSALRHASQWQQFKVRLCPALAGIQLLNDGGYLTATLDPEARIPAKFQFHAMPRTR